MILLKANDKLKVIFHKIIKTMGENVQWGELFLIHNNSLILLGPIRSLFFQFDNKKVYSNIIDITVDEADVEMIQENEMLENALNMTLYTFGKWGGIKGLTVEKDYDQLNHLLSYIVKEIEIESSLTKDNLRFFKAGIQITYEEVIQLILEHAKGLHDLEEEANKAKEEEEKRLGLWHNMVWKGASFSFIKEELTQEDKKASRLGNQFYMVNYKCPNCNHKLYMIVYPKGQEFRIETQEEGVFLARAYTCNQCHQFFTPKPKKLLSENEVYHLDFEDDQMAYEDYLELLGMTGQRVANSNFNEYESDYLKKEAKEEEEPNLFVFDAYEAMTQEELDELLERLESGFYSNEIVERYRDAIQNEIQKRKDSQRKEATNQALEDEKKESKDKKPKDKEYDPIVSKRKDDKKEEKREKSLLKEGKIHDKASVEKEETLSISKEKRQQLLAFIKEEKEDDFNQQITNLPINQLEEIKSFFQVEESLEGEQKNRVLSLMDKALLQRNKEDIQLKVKECEGKSYAQVRDILKEVSRVKMEEADKDEILHSLKQLKERKGKKELEQIISKVPQLFTKKQYEQFKERIDSYEEMDTRLYKKILKDKWDDAQKLEIKEYMKRANPRNRTAYLDAYQRLKDQGYDECNVSPVLEQLQKKVFEIDMAAIHKICEEPADLSFEEGLKVYEEISLGEYLPELKEDILTKIDQRLTKLKADECEQLVNKLRKELGGEEKQITRMYFHNVRKMLRNKLADAEDVLIQNAVNSYAKDKEKYEYPILVCDTSYAQNAESGFLLTPNAIYYRSLFEGGRIPVEEIEQIFAKDSILQKGIYLRTKRNTIKIANSLQKKNLSSISQIIDSFVAYLKEKPESRNISYLTKEVHKVKCCYRCGYVYQEGNICPKCGSKMND